MAANDELFAGPQEQTAPAQPTAQEQELFAGPQQEEASPDYANMPWSQVGSQAIQNAPSSAMTQVYGLGHALMHPV